ncbi:MAG: polymer-forming cytoskeletal protein [Bacteroidales bacterium]|nr:polymer-forming cytoskeletal protein [Bacteroidales bacterium]MDY6002434.1 polymer-forming cytoskeletal protein [Candidatus Cryptobacteroides sp.]
MNANFPKQNENTAGNVAGESSKISAGTTIRGEIQSPNDIMLDGNFEGKIISQSRVTVGTKANIKGDIICNNCDFSGKIEGNFFVKDTLSLSGSCIVNGDLHIKRLQVELDAKFNGNCHMISEEEFSRLTNSGKPATPPEPAKTPQSAAEPATTQQSQQRFSVPHPFGEPKKQNFPEA